MQIISKNKKIYHNYEMVKIYKCGIVLKGCEVKSLIFSGCSIDGKWCQFDEDSNLNIIGMVIPES